VTEFGEFSGSSPFLPARPLTDNAFPDLDDQKSLIKDAEHG
jgi:hypothetical protein